MPEYLPMLAGWIATASAAAAVTCLMIAWATGRMERLEERGHGDPGLTGCNTGAGRRSRRRRREHDKAVGAKGPACSQAPRRRGGAGLKLVESATLLGYQACRDGQMIEAERMP